MNTLFVLHLRPEGPGPDPVRRLRAALKRLLRNHGLRCTRAHDALGRFALRNAHGTNDPAAQLHHLARRCRRLARLLDCRSLPADVSDSLALTLASLTIQVEGLEHQIGEVLASLPE
jgi:hypothetical protein